jgi:hypothetical protein
MEIAKLVLLCIAAVCGAGAVIGEAAAWVCPEVFTLGRPPAFGSLHPALLGPLWGIIEFLPHGAIVGVAIGIAASVGERPAVKAFFFRRPLLGHGVLMLVIATGAGGIGWFAVRNGSWPVLGALAAAVEPARHPLVGAVWWANLGAQCANLIGGITIAAWIWRKRATFARIVRGEAP